MHCHKKVFNPTSLSPHLVSPPTFETMLIHARHPWLCPWAVWCQGTPLLPKISPHAAGWSMHIKCFRKFLLVPTFHKPVTKDLKLSTVTPNTKKWLSSHNPTTLLKATWRVTSHALSPHGCKVLPHEASLVMVIVRVLTEIILNNKMWNFTKTWIGTSFFENLDAKDLISLTDERSHTWKLKLIKSFKIKKQVTKFAS